MQSYSTSAVRQTLAAIFAALKLKAAAMKCINSPYRCSRIGFSGGKECCGYLLAIGETKFISSAGIINEPCPLPAATEHYGPGENITQQTNGGEKPKLPKR